LQSQPLELQKGDIFLGTKSIPFRIKPHDPRAMTKYVDSWSEANGNNDNSNNGDASDAAVAPEWVYNEEEMREDLFRHRFGKRPNLSMILASISVVAEKDMPTTGNFDFQADNERYAVARWGVDLPYWSIDAYFLLSHDMPSVDETEGVILDNARDLVVLQQLSYFEEEDFCKRRKATECTEGKKSTLSYEITAKWDNDTQQGVSSSIVFFWRRASF